MGKLKTQIPVKFEKLEEHKVKDTRFTKVKIQLMHTGQNYNGSYFTKDVVKDSIPSLENTPILAYVEPNSEGDVDASDHRMAMERDENGVLVYKNKGVPYGVIPSNNNARFETKVCDDGVEREFLTVEGLLWNKWDDIIDILDRDVVKHQSMELHEDYSGYFEEETNLFHFTEFKFYGACILGLDHMPAMSDSTIELDFGQDSMKELNKYVQSKMEQFKKYSLKKEEVSKGGEVLKDKLELLKEFSVSEEDIEELGKDLEEITLEELKVIVKELLEKIEEADATPADDDLEVEPETELEDKDEEEDEEDEDDLEEELEETIGDEPEGEEDEELISFEELQSDYDKLKSEFEALKEEAKELKAFKAETIAKEREIAEAELFGQYEVLADVMEFEELKEKSAQFEKIEDLEKELALLFVKNKANMNLDKEEDKEDNSINFNLDDVADETNKRYGNLFEKYSK